MRHRQLLLQEEGHVLSKIAYIIVVSLVLSVAACTKSPRLILDEPNLQHTHLRHFRTLRGVLPAGVTPSPSTTGLAALHASGSAQFSGVGWTELLQQIPDPQPIIVDLRQESHGFLNHAVPISWYGERDWANLGKTLSQIQADEATRLRRLLKKGKAKLTHKPPDTRAVTVEVKTVGTEKELVEGHGLRSMRFPIPDHRRPDTATVDQFVAWVQGLSPKTWLHVHCEGGKGRTTTILAMLDMMHNANQVPFKDILERQFLLGGENLMDTRPADDWRHPYFVERLQFLRDFYTYAQRTTDGFKTPFSAMREVSN
jgi:hypothetical protein